MWTQPTTTRSSGSESERPRRHCVWSLALRRQAARASAEIEELIELTREGRVAMIGPIRQEILSGIRAADQYAKLGDPAESLSRRAAGRGRPRGSGHVLQSLPRERATGLQHRLPDVRGEPQKGRFDPDNRQGLPWVCEG